MCLDGTPNCATAVATLLRAVRDRRSQNLETAAASLAGRGDGLTPVGDDLLAGVAVALSALGPSAGLSVPELRRLITPLTSASVRSRTSSLSATLLQLAAHGRTLEPVVGVLDLDDDVGWRAALERLLKTGHSTGGAAYGPAPCTRSKRSKASRSRH